MKRETTERETAKRKTAKRETTLLIVGTLMTIALIVAIVLLTNQAVAEFKWPPAILIPIIGLLTFFGTLALTNAVSQDPNFQKGEIRKAMAASLLSVYFFTLAVTLYADASPVYRLQGEPSTAEETSADTSSDASADANDASDKTPMDLVNTMLDGLNKIMVTVVAFYFGGRAVEETARAVSSGSGSDSATRKNAGQTEPPVDPQ